MSNLPTQQEHRDSYGFQRTQDKFREAFEAQERQAPNLKTWAIGQEAGKQETVSETLDARGKRYGPFKGHAEITQRLKHLIACALSDNGKRLAHDQQEALDMICHKIGRIINGDADYDDSWIDIAGYAQLVADRLRGRER